MHRELTEKQSLAFSMTFLPTKLEFTTASAESSFVFEFSSPDARSNFEQTFEDAKKKLGEGNRAAVEIKYILKKEKSFQINTFFLTPSAMNKDQWDPEFLKAIPIMKTRSGMQVRVTGTAFRI